MAKFLSQAWFDEVAALNAQAGDLNLAPNLDSVLLNAIITGDDAAELHLKNGKIAQGLVDNANSTVTVDRETLVQIISTGDVNIAIEAFMLGKIRVDGDMTQVMALQSAKPSQEQKALFKQILAITEF
ncbi:SCP2 sterol-binding domain-containing protein [Moraxella sp. FZLJ2107]|uniref:SCP2 sterol-binding domain-containing protein n=1 Tax=unclassified Moraxella TaxID=2685852 RepID=UPI00209C35D0|nr:MULTISPECIES: SCP2 sterol-binding domain-containing protein [unclassified Moraxella]USZ14436.1 SCP2 sterol-binding domain-containing protein [Moraxella sp. FZFQ2102]UTO05109.1 SCP2 sterol-binding domain-containing protein [Moraxella sp. FZLJ2107]UTO21844.1 SCP2 sterol-binding domain-containing protein [Moraxella sp. FZLJ2109]